MPQWYNPSGPLPPDQIADSFYELVIYSLRVDPSLTISNEEIRSVIAEYESKTDDEGSSPEA